MSGPYDACRMNASRLDSTSLPARPIAGASSRSRTGRRSPPGCWRSLLGVQAALLVTDLTGGSRHDSRRRAGAAARRRAARGSTSRPSPTRICSAARRRAAERRCGQCAADQHAAGAHRHHRRRRPEHGPRHPRRERQLGQGVRASATALPGGAKLHSVYGDRVILDRNGSLESLSLPRQYHGRRRPWRRRLPPASPDATTRHGRAHAPAHRRASPGVDLRDHAARSRCSRRASSAATGSTRAATARRSSRLGLRPGDLVTAINGTPLDDPARGQEIFQHAEFRRAEARVTVMRNGRQQDLSLNMAQVAAAGRAAGDRERRGGWQIPQLQAPRRAGGPRRRTRHDE